jgi:transcriptional regulator with XRE-family HTH domain
MKTTSFGQRLRQFRVERDKSMREAAREAGISVTYLSKLESDEGNPTLDVIGKMANLYGVRVDDLTLGIDPERELPDFDASLAHFIEEYSDRFPELHEHDWKTMLNGIRLRGRSPQNSDDWLTIFVDLRRALTKKTE